MKDESKINDTIRSKVVLVGETRGPEESSMPHFSQGKYEQLSGRIQRRVQSDSKPKCGKED